MLDFITRENLSADDVWSKFWNTPYVVLEAKEAEALLEDRRLYAESHSEYFGEREIEYKTKHGEIRKMTIGIDFSDLSNCTVTDGVFVAQAYKKSINESKYGNNTTMRPVANIEMRLLEDKKGDKYLHLDTFNEGYSANEAVMRALLDVIEAKMPELGAKYIMADEAVQGDFC